MIPTKLLPSEKLNATMHGIKINEILDYLQEEASKGERRCNFKELRRCKKDEKTYIPGIKCPCFDPPEHEDWEAGIIDKLEKVYGQKYFYFQETNPMGKNKKTGEWEIKHLGKQRRVNRLVARKIDAVILYIRDNFVSKEKIKRAIGNIDDAPKTLRPPLRRLVKSLGLGD